MNVYISIVSHGHKDIIEQLCLIEELSKEFIVVIKNNLNGDNFEKYSHMRNVYLLDNNYGKGFGENNNIVFKFCRDKLGMTDNDYFLLINPDVSVSNTSINKLLCSMEDRNIQLSTINLFLDEEYKIPDNSIRRFPNFWNFFSSFIGLKNKSVYDKTKFSAPTPVDWAAGSFLAFSTKLYEKLGGFDKNYFMYCEDIDICYRSKKLFNVSIIFFPNIKALHFARHASKKIFSKHFVWHVFSVCRFLLSK